MIQRIQTVYLALVAVLSILGLCLPLAQYYVGTTQVATFNNFTYTAAKGYDTFGAFSIAPLAFGVLLSIVILLTLVSIMLFRYRMRQLRLIIFSTILLVGYVITYAVFAYFYDLNLNLYASTAYEKGIEIAALPTFHLKFVAVFPVLSIILNCLAIQGIRKDEALVRSLDRIR